MWDARRVGQVEGAVAAAGARPPASIGPIANIARMDESTDPEPAFGHVFLAELEREARSVLFDFAQRERIQRMTQPELVTLLRQHSSASYADVQRLKDCTDPAEFARYLLEERRRQATLLALRMFGPL